MKFIKFITFIIIILLSPSLSFAQIPIPTGTPLGKIEGLGPLGTIIKLLSPTDVTPASNLLAQILSNVIGLITIFAGIWFTIQFLIAGFNWISSSGNKEKVLEAQHKITNSILGLTVVVIAYAITNLLGKLLGIPNILNIGAAIKLLAPK